MIITKPEQFGAGTNWRDKMILYVIMATNELGKEIKCGEFTSKSSAIKFLKSEKKLHADYKEFWIHAMNLDVYF